MARSNPRQKGLCRSQGGLTSHCANDVPSLAGSSDWQRRGFGGQCLDPPGQGPGDGARTCDRRVPADLRADSLSTKPPTIPSISLTNTYS
ncbi:hypothetical protein PoB_005078400 [Plakobranchus ocellatus]|uniref:Uncharacterized protein n=1 Tax=Plakobranchus ocellatus TaxID=259542 RepID=A0AAV4BZI2_9GAST|nr:hypothetical protein PoB_005078400 [Plakobranchus ocellatus]